MSHPPRPTIKDVARAARVSPGVASSVLGGNRNPAIRVSPETQQRIRSAAVALGYRPNALARSLQRQRTQTLLLAMYSVPNITRSAFHGEVLDGVLSRSLALGYDVTIHAVRKEDAEKPGVLGDGRADGCLWVAPWLDDAAVAALPTAGRPGVILYARVQGDWTCVVADNRQGTDAAVGHLAGLGHERLLFLDGSEGWQPYDCRERSAAFVVACEERGLRGDVIPLRDLAHRLASRRAQRPTGLIGWHDPVAVRAMRCARECGLAVPADLSVIGFDSTPACDAAQPPLTSVHQPIREMAERAVDLLTARIDMEPPEDASGPAAGILTFPCRLDVRGSTGPAPAAQR
jgi:LacI family transcriptional regulator